LRIGLEQTIRRPLKLHQSAVTRADDRDVVDMVGLQLGMGASSLCNCFTPSTWRAPALGQAENEGDDRQPDQHANPEWTRHVVTCVCEIH
jgi:hypothetical protein